LKDVERALSLNPSYHMAYDVLGMAHMLAANMSDAIASLEKAVLLSESDPFLPYRLFMLSIAYTVEKRFQEATDTIERAIQLRPNQRSYFVLKALICRSTGDEAGSSKAEAQASQLQKEPSIYVLHPPLPEEQTDFADQFSPN
jgi:lipopolysaccharide biosynthesis regulator YciM